MPRHNPIEDYEYLYQKRKRDTERTSHSTAFRYLLLFIIIFPNVMMILLTLGMFYQCGQTAFNWREFFDNDWLDVVVSISYIPVMLTFFSTPLYSFNLATNSMNREIRRNNWDLLRLTGISARQLVFGKAWAVQRITRNDYAYMIGTRLVTFVFFTIYTDVALSDIFGSAPMTCNSERGIDWYISLVIGVVIVTLFELMASIAGGLLLGLLRINRAIMPLVNFLGYALMRGLSAIFIVTAMGFIQGLMVQSAPELAFWSFIATFIGLVLILMTFTLAWLIAAKVYRFT